MQELKSWSFYLDLVSCLYRDIASCYDVALRFQTKELDYIRLRVSTEGMSFLTRTLPAFGKALDRALSTTADFKIQGFERSPGSVRPLFLGWLTKLVFDDCGVELLNSSSVAIRDLRQLLYLLYKLEIPYEPDLENKVIDSFVSVDAALVDFDEAAESDPVVPKAREIISRVLGSLDPRAIRPKHGPGSVATGESTVEKGKFARLYSRLEQFYPFTEYCCFSLSHVSDAIEEIGLLEERTESTAKVALVPKDSRGPRLISLEPLEIQWIQQGLGKLIEEHISAHPLTAGFVNFDDQAVNQRLALAGSRGEPWVTLDMKDASDRVSNQLVVSLFALHPDLSAAMQACRSGETCVPDGRIVKLNKFAPMGSRLCFPVEALVFYALILGTLHVYAGLSLRKLRGRVYVFGDDIIMRREDYALALEHLPRFGLMFNPTKCCVAGNYRESCGVDAHKGVNVTPSRLRTMWCHHRPKPEVLTSYVALRNALVGRCYLEAGAYIEHHLRSVYGDLPYTDQVSWLLNGAAVSTAGGPAYASVLAPAREMNSKLKKRINRFGRLEVYSWLTVPLKERAPADSWSELLRRHSDDWGASGGFYAIPRRNRLKRGWVEI